jgi:hypothetical protein
MEAEERGDGWFRGFAAGVVGVVLVAVLTMLGATAYQDFLGRLAFPPATRDLQMGQAITTLLVAGWVLGIPSAALVMNRRWRGRRAVALIISGVALAVWTPALLLYLSFENACALGSSYPIPGMSCG